MRYLRRVWLLFAGLGLWILTTAGPALADHYPGGDKTPDVGGEKFFPAQEGFAKTGSDIVWFVLVGLAILLIGFAIRSLSKRSPRSEP